MRLFDWLIGPEIVSPWQDDTNLEAVTWAHLLDVDPSTVAVTRSAAMSIPSAAKARNTIAASIGRLPIIAHRNNGAASQPRILQQPDPGTTRVVTMTWTVDELIWYGRAYWKVTGRDSSGRVTAAQALPQSRIDFAADNLTPIGFDGSRHADWIRIDGTHDGLLRSGARALRSAIAIEDAVRRASEMPVPMVELHQTSQNPTLSASERRQLVEDWVAARRRPDGAVAYTSHNIEAKAHGVPVENLLIEARNAAALDIARLFGVPAWVVDAPVNGSSLTYSNVPSRSRELVDYALAPYMAAIEQRLSMDDILPHGTWARIDTGELLRGDLKERAEAYSAAIAAGIMTADDARAAEAGQPMEGNRE